MFAVFCRCHIPLKNCGIDDKRVQSMQINSDSTHCLLEASLGLKTVPKIGLICKLNRAFK